MCAVAKFPLRQRVRILVATSDATLANDVAKRLDDNANLEVVGVAGDCAEALLHAEQLKPDVIVADLPQAGSAGGQSIVTVLARKKLDPLGRDLRVVGYLRRDAAASMLDVVVAMHASRIDAPAVST